jgi:hypothetical protein
MCVYFHSRQDRFLKLRQEKLGVAQPADKGKAGLKRVNSMEIKRKDSERALALSPQKGSDPDTDQVQASKNSFLGLGAPFASLKGAFEVCPLPHLLQYRPLFLC